MEEYGQEVGVSVPLFVDADFYVDAEGYSTVTVLLWTGDEDQDAVEAPLDLEEIIESYIEVYGTPDEYHKLYLLAHEFERLAERMREKAGTIEDSAYAIRDLFDF